MLQLVHRCLTIGAMLAGLASGGSAIAEPDHAQMQVPAPTVGASLRADGTQFALKLADGSLLHSADLLGATLRMADGRWLRIDAVSAIQDLHGKTLWQHSLSTPDGQGGWRNYCTAHPDGSRMAMLVPGRAQGDGTVDDDPEAFAITCTSGAQGKCLRFGYRPWETATMGLRAAYNACIRMVRADYGGEGRPYTENGKVIDVFDHIGIQQADVLEGQDFEAGWSPQGAVCVRHVRVARNVTLDTLEHRYPALRGRVGPICTEEFARLHGATVFNRSDTTGAAPPGVVGDAR